jgi:hypothetical protein
MKKLSLTVLLSLLCIHLISAQKSDNKWYNRSNPVDKNQWVMGFGLNTVNNSDTRFKELTNSDHWAFAKIPFYLSAETKIDSQFSIGATLSFNYFTEGKVFEGQTILGKDEGGNDADYLAFDLAIKYSFSKLLNLKAFDPYVSVGTGISHFGDYSREENLMVLEEDGFTLNTGLGLNYWFSSTWGVNFNMAAKWGLGENYTNHLQSSLGVLYSIK